VRTGVAVSSADGIFASPIGVISSLAEAENLIGEYTPIALYVGLPLSLSGAHTASTQFAIDFAKELQKSGHQVRLVDERLTTVSAANLLRSAGKDSKKAKSSIDAAAATMILEQALSIERNGGVPGVPAEDFE
jgi:putative Holliday junction resolvase